jgi:Domain of unknown function (DU1801)
LSVGDPLVRHTLGAEDVNLNLNLNVQAQIDRYIAAQDPPKRHDIEAIDRIILAASPNCKLWFLDGRDSDNKIVTNENIGYGTQTLKYANGGTREFYRIGLSSNATGISLYLMGIEDRKYLPKTYGKKIGKAKVTGYCVRFRRLTDVNLDILEEMIQTHMTQGGA